MKTLSSVSVELTKSADTGYDATFVMSASSPDRVKDTIDPAAYAGSVGKKLIALFNHDAEKPIGYWENIRQVAGQLQGSIKFATTQLGQMLKQLVADGVPMGASIRFRGMGSKNAAGGIHFSTLDLTECSIVSIPCHPMAVQVAKSFGIDLDTLTKPESKPALTPTQAAALDRAKNILAENTREPQDTAVQAFDKVAADARAYLVANEASIDPRVDIEIYFSSGGYKVCFERS